MVIFAMFKTIEMTEYKNHPLYKNHTLDSAMDSLWNFYKSHFLVLFLISFIFSLGANMFSITIDTENIMQLAYDEDLTAMRDMMRQIALMMLPVVLITLYGYVFLSVYILQSPEQGNTYGRYFIDSWKYFLTFIIITILFIPVSILALGAGLLALLIGVLFSVVWLVALFAFILPLLMTEGNDISNAILRSFRLLHRHFGSNLGWTAVIIVILLIVSIVISGLALIPFAGTFLQTMANPEEAVDLVEMAKNPVFLVFSSALNALVMPVFPIFAFVLCFNSQAREDEMKDI